MPGLLFAPRPPHAGRQCSPHQLAPSRPAAPPRPGPLHRAAQGVGQNVMSYETGDGTWSGYEVELLRQLLLVELAG